MNFIFRQPGVRLFYLRRENGPSPLTLLSKAAGPFLAPTNRLVVVGHGWWALHVTPAETDTLGPLAWWIDLPEALAEPQDLVTPLQHGHVDQQALQNAFADLSIGFVPNEGLSSLIKRPLYQFLISLQ